MAGETATAVETTETATPAAPATPATEWNRERPSSFAAFDAQETDRALGRTPAATPKPAESAQPAPTGDDAPATDAQGAPLKDAQGRFISKRAAEAERRTREAVDRATAGTRTENEALKRRIAELEGRSAQPAAQPGTTQQPAQQPEKPKEDKEPVLDDFLNEPDPYLAHARALARWEVRQELKQRDEKSEQRTAQERAQQTVMERVTAHTAREAELKKTVPDYDTKTQAVRESLDVRSPLTLAVLDSPVSEKLILHLAEHPEDFDRIGRLGVSNLSAALREIGRLEAKYDTTTETAAASPAAPTAPSKKTVSSAPEPPTTLGTRPAEPADASRAAVARKDFRAFDEEETRKDLAKRRRA